MSALATVEQKSFKGKFTTKIHFPIGLVTLPLLMLALKSRNTLFDKYFVQHARKILNKILCLTIQHFELFDKKKK